MLLAEEIEQYKAGIFFELIEEFAVDMYEEDPSYVMTEEDAYITSIILEYFIENYKIPTINESAYMSLTGTDINQELYEEIVEMLLDESVGSFVAGAVHGVGGFLAKAKHKMAQSKANKLKSASSTAQKTSTAANKAASSYKGSGVGGAIKSSYLQAKAKKRADKADTKNLAYRNAQADRDLAGNASKAKQAKRKNLATKIDTGISNIKTKTSNAIKSGASKIGSIAGKVFG